MAYTPYQQAVRAMQNIEIDMANMQAPDHRHSTWDQEWDQLQDDYEAAEAAKKQAFQEAIRNGEEPTWIQ